MILKKASKEAIKYACLNFHYAKSVPVNVHGYSVFNDKNEWCGVVLYGTGANNNIAKTYDLKQGEVIELVRMALNGKQESTSKTLSLSLKLIKKDVPLCKLVVSYADKDQNHQGIIYQATNWHYVGTSMENKKDCSYIIDGKRIHGKTLSDKLKRLGYKKTEDNLKKVFNTDDVVPYITKGKIKYVYILDKSMVQLVENIRMKYPKCVSSVNVNTSNYQLEIGGSIPTETHN